MENLEKDLPAEIKESLTIYRDVLGRLIRLIDESIAGAIGHPAGSQRLAENLVRRPSIKRVLVPMLQALGSSSHTIAILSEKPGLQTRDCFSVSRSVIELAVNLCYILATGEEAAEQAERHAKQKCFRDLERESTIGGQTIQLKFGGQGKLETPSDISEMISEFTARSGRERDWTDLSVDARCEVVGRNLGKQVLAPLHWARFAVYRHSSEILHGTLFGALFFLGVTDPTGPPTSAANWLVRIAQQNLMILMAAALAVIAVLLAIASRLDVPHLAVSANNLEGELRAAPWLTQASTTRNDS